MASDQERIAILFIHGILGTTSHFEPFLSLVPPNWSICNLSLKGHGGSVKDFSLDSMTEWMQLVMNALEELINKCDGYEPYYCDSHNDSFIQCALVDDSTDSPVMYGFVGLLINDECGYVEVSGLVAPDFRHRGHFRNMLSICYRKLKSSSAGNLELISPIRGELLNSSLCGDICFYEYLYQLDKAHFNLESIQAAEPDNAEYYLEGDDYLMYLPEYEEPVALLYLDTQNTFVNVYGVFVDE